jgi:hypothetical protein
MDLMKENSRISVGVATGGIGLLAAGLYFYSVGWALIGVICLGVMVVWNYQKVRHNKKINIVKQALSQLQNQYPLKQNKTISLKVPRKVADRIEGKKLSFICRLTGRNLRTVSIAPSNFENAKTFLKDDLASREEAQVQKKFSLLYNNYISEKKNRLVNWLEKDFGIISDYDKGSLNESPTQVSRVSHFNLPDKPAKSPGKDWKWNGPCAIGSKKGSWYHQNSGHSLRPNLNYPKPIGPHWCLRQAKKSQYRLYLDGSYEGIWGEVMKENNRLSVGESIGIIILNSYLWGCAAMLDLVRPGLAAFISVGVIVVGMNSRRNKIKEERKEKLVVPPLVVPPFNTVELSGKAKKKALEHIQSSLSNGHLVSRYFSKQQDLDKGKVTTFLPSTINSESIDDYENGIQMNLAPPLNWVSQKIQTYLLNSNLGMGLLENYNLQPEHLRFNEHKRILVIDNHSYNTLLNQNTSLEDIEDQIDEAESVWIFNAFFGEDINQEVANKLKAGSNVTISEDWVKPFLETIKLVVVMAFDGEGYLVWEKC